MNSSEPKHDSLPFSDEAERGLLHCLTRKSILETYSTLPVSVFYIPAHRLIFERLFELLEKNLPFDFKTISDRARIHGDLEEIGGIETLDAIWHDPDTSFDHEYFAGEVLDCYRRREALAELRELNAKLYDRRTDSGASIRETVERTLTKLSLSTDKKERSFRSQVLDTVDLLDRRHKDPGISGIRFGIPALDSELYGLQPSEQVVIAGPTSTGKSALATQAVLENAYKQQASAIFSLEMSAPKLITRMISCCGKISMKSLKRGFMTEFELARMNPAIKQLGDFKIFLEDEFAGEIGAIVNRCRILKAREKISLVVVDYIQLVDWSNHRSNDSHERMVANISRNLRRMAKELDLVVLILSQLNDDGRLRDSRAIGHDADVVLVIEPSEDHQSEAHIRIDKQRDGERGKRIPVTFLGQFMKFESR